MATFTPSGDFESALTQARRDVEHWRAARGEGNNWRNDPKWAEWAGDKLPEMMRDRELTIRSLDSPDVAIRLTAACLLAQYWLANERFAPYVLRVAFEDPSPAVRGAALYSLRRVEQHVSDPTGLVHKLLAALFPPLPDAVTAGASRDVEDTRHRIGAGFMEMWDRKAGIDAARMRESRAVAESYLAHCDPQIRCTALSTLTNYWKADDKEFKELCGRLVFQDPDVEVRSLALACLAGYYSGTDDSRVGRLAAQLALDDSAPEKLRIAAYRALVTIRGMPPKAMLDTCAPRFRFPEDVDWALVNTFLGDRG